MHPKLKAFVRETIDEMLNSLTTEERLKGLALEELLKGLSVDQLIKVLPPETLKELTRYLEADVPFLISQ